MKEWIWAKLGLGQTNVLVESKWENVFKRYRTTGSGIASGKCKRCGISNFSIRKSFVNAIVVFIYMKLCEFVFHYANACRMARK